MNAIKQFEVQPVEACKSVTGTFDKNGTRYRIILTYYPSRRIFLVSLPDFGYSQEVLDLAGLERLALRANESGVGRVDAENIQMFSMYLAKALMSN